MERNIRQEAAAALLSSFAVSSAALRGVDAIPITSEPTAQREEAERHAQLSKQELARAATALAASRGVFAEESGAALHKLAQLKAQYQREVRTAVQQAASAISLADEEAHRKWRQWRKEKSLMASAQARVAQSLIAKHRGPL